MIRNYIKVMLRQMRRNKLYSFVNIAGLSIGITACLLIGLYIWNELRYDRFNEKANRIARVTMEFSNSSTVTSTAFTGTKVGPQFLRTFPQVEAFVRMENREGTLANGIQSFEEKNILFADSAFFSLFSFPLLRGDATNVLKKPYTVVLTPKIARKYFGDDDPVGKTLRLNDTRDYEVTGIVAEAPTYSQVHYDMIASFSSLRAAKNEEWFSANYFTYLLLHDKDQLPGLQKAIPAYMSNIAHTELQMTGTDYLTYHLQPLTQVHLHSSLEGLEPHGNLIYIYILGGLAILILLIACVNYTNLAIAQSTGRSTEIGIRKVLGARGEGLFRQFIGESTAVTFMAIFLSLAAAYLLLPSFNGITGKIFLFSQFLHPVPLIGLFILGIVVSLMAGSYPAWVLSRTGLVKILKTGYRLSSSGGGLRKSLIVVQFIISCFLVAATIIIMQQISYIRHKDIGFIKDKVVSIPLDPNIKQGYASLKRAVALSPGVESVSGTYEDPTFVQWSDGVEADNGKGKISLQVAAMPVDVDFISTMGMHIKSGVDFTESDLALQDTSKHLHPYQASFVLNEKAASLLGWTPEQALGQTIHRNSPGIVKAVVKDFNFTSLHDPIGPMVLFLDTSQVQEMLVRVNGKNISQTIESIAKVWKERGFSRPFSYHFLDESFNQLYEVEGRTSKLFSLFSGLAIILACMGLFALAAFTTIQRKKEIGIRKVLGAGIAHVTFMVAKEFLLLVLIGLLIASPLVWFAANIWLQNFAYRIGIGWWVFGLAGLLAVTVTLITVGYHAIRAASANPVKSLRTD